MNLKSRTTEPDAEMTTGIKNCPYCNSTVYTDETICRYCDKDLAIRVCLYCKNTIPADEDPCHYCGRLEPAENIAEIEAAQRSSFERGVFWDAVLSTLDLIMGR
jgi:RNA polymerase subunit RPABC4/transcription elongation factor Spt4